MSGLLKPASRALNLARLSNWPQTFVTPIERLMVLGTMVVGAYFAMDDSSG